MYMYKYGFYTYSQDDFQKTLLYVSVNISANTHSRETSRLSTELAWQGVSNEMRIDFLRLREKIRGFVSLHMQNGENL